MAAQVSLNVAAGDADIVKAFAADCAAYEATAPTKSASLAPSDTASISSKVRGVSLNSSATAKKDASGNEVLDFAVWAEAPEDQLAVLQSIVDELAMLAGVESFMPHVTLWRATMSIDSDPDVLIAEVEKAINEWKGKDKADAMLICKYDGVEERRGSLVIDLRPTPALLDLHETLHGAIEGLTAVERYPFEPHVTLLKELKEDEDPSIHLARMMEKGWIDEVDYAVLVVGDFECHKLFVAQADLADCPNDYLAIREFDV